MVLERHAGPLFRVGMAEMNGWRSSMEDSHVVVMRDKENWGFFGVFDGHGGSQCSEYIAKRLTDKLSKEELPKDDATVKAMMLALDKEFLDSKEGSGSTGTFVFIIPPEKNGGAGKHLLRVGNIGDSRVLLGRLDGTMVEGPGTDGGLTTDHKPDDPSERARIERTGGYVSAAEMGGCARVNGDLAVSRAFGDAGQKQTGGPAQEDHPVTAEPEFTTITCEPTDFLLLVCDGISEGDFPNREVIKLAAEVLRKELASGKAPDLCQVCTAVCRKALVQNSRDNLSCMIVLLGGGEVGGATHELIPGAFSCPDSDQFRSAYTAMADRAGLTLVQSLEKRFDDITMLVAETEKDGDKISQHNQLKDELGKFGEGPSKDLVVGSEERLRWFENWLGGVAEAPGNAGYGGQSSLGGMGLDPSIMQMLQQNPALMGSLRAQGLGDLGGSQAQDKRRMASVDGTVDQLREAIENCPTLKWNDAHAQMCGEQCSVIKDDPKDGTSEVQFSDAALKGTKAWLPTSLLRTRQVLLSATEEEVKTALDGHPALKWDERLAKVCGEQGDLIEEDDKDGTSRVRFLNTSMIAWLPTGLLKEVS